MSAPCPLCGGVSLFNLRGELADAAGALGAAAKMIEEHGFPSTAALLRARALAAATAAGCSERAIADVLAGEVA